MKIHILGLYIAATEAARQSNAAQLKDLQVYKFNLVMILLYACTLIRKSLGI